MRKIYLGSILSIFICLQCALCDISITPRDLTIKLNETDTFLLSISNISETSNITKATLKLIVQHADILKLNPPVDDIKIKNDFHLSVNVTAVGLGHSVLYGNISDPLYKNYTTDAYLRVTVYKNAGLDTFSIVIGWIYFVAWSVSFYPQIYINWKRKSVVGLNFDFIILNLIGFTLYSMFNLGLYFITDIKAEYSERYPRGLIPVKVNDIVFAVHATVATILTIIQCFLYERDEQRVSITARCIIGVFGAFIGISVILAGTQIIHWLDFLYYCSYVKLTITLIKYVPQAYMNYKRKSTVGWSIGNIFLDFTGGSLSMLQMILDSYNYDDWVSIFGDPTKFGLGLFSVAFDIFFIVQHYILYRHSRYSEN